MPAPTFVVAGGARCGTTGLVEGLRRHPRVFVTDPKEPHYFALHRIGANFTAPGDAHTINRVAVTERDAYLRLYDGVDDRYAAWGDGSVSTLYYYSESIPALVEMNPNIKVVILLREPVDRAYSAYGYMRARGLEPETDFLRAVALEEERREAGWHHIWHYTRMSKYAQALEAMYEAIPSENLRVWYYDDLNDDYERVLAEVYQFLGVGELPVSAEGEVPRVNISGTPRLRIVHSGLTWATKSAVLRSAVKRTTTYRMRERVRRMVLRDQSLSVDVRRQLAPAFSADLERVSRLLPSGQPDWMTRGAQTR